VSVGPVQQSYPSPLHCSTTHPVSAGPAYASAANTQDSGAACHDMPTEQVLPQQVLHWMKLSGHTNLGTWLRVSWWAVQSANNVPDLAAVHSLTAPAPFCCRRPWRQQHSRRGSSASWRSSWQRQNMKLPRLRQPPRQDRFSGCWQDPGALLCALSPAHCLLCVDTQA
jgi:hypothetical protein